MAHSLDALYPPGPSDIPAELTRPSAQYRRQAWIAVGSLLLFILAYLGLAGWFVHTSIRAISRDNLFVGASCGLLAIFMLKGLLFVRQGGDGSNMEVTSSNQPQLFNFIHRLADEAGAPRPHRVFLSSQVNAAVFYDISPLNLVFPSRKNLLIGLPLVNALTLSELKAVLAHEFGHFAQRSMAVGSWVYIAQQVAMALVARRDWLDQFLSFISRLDIRIAWIGWCLKLVVWSLRSLLDSLLRLVVLAQRALSRQMEFRADLVAVALTGSDELIHALHKLRAADEAWDWTVRFLADQMSREQLPKDFFYIQTLVSSRLGEIRGDALWGKIPPAGTEPPAQRRLFKQGFAQPPQMWATHPANADREENAKRFYVPAAHDPRSAWDLFADTDHLQAEMRSLLAGDRKFSRLLDNVEASTEVERHFSSPRLDPRYRGAYLQRELTRHARDVKELFEPPRDFATAEVSGLYPETLRADLQRVKELENELAALKALTRGEYEATGSRLVHRGREIKRQDLASIIRMVTSELQADRARLRAHDLSCRASAMLTAKAIGLGWPEHLRGLISVLHYAEHARADLVDVAGVVGNVVSVITADGRVSSGELNRLVAACNELYAVMKRLYGEALAVQPDPGVLSRLGTDTWCLALGELGLPLATKENINEWMQVQDGWVDASTAALNALANATLEQLLAAEDVVAEMNQQQKPIEAAPGASTVPYEYALLLEGSERPRQLKLGWWDRFQTADGPVAGLVRVLVALMIIGAVIWAGATLSMVTAT